MVVFVAWIIAAFSLGAMMNARLSLSLQHRLFVRDAFDAEINFGFLRVWNDFVFVCCAFVTLAVMILRAVCK